MERNLLVMYLARKVAVFDAALSAEQNRTRKRMEISQASPLLPLPDA